jgi:ribbon-helix-helix CopG family protein
MAVVYYTVGRMRTVTVRLPEALAAEIDAESRARGISKSDVVRGRLEGRGKGTPRSAPSVDAIADLIGSVDGLPPKLSAQKKAYLRRTGYGRKRHR